MRFFIILFTYILICTKLFSQETNNSITISKNKVVIDGKQYYLHNVLKGETLYSISKAYNLDVKDVAIENPDLFNGLQPDMTLKIPLIKGINSNKEEILAAGQYIIHKVEKGETVYSISKKYNIKPNEIIVLNPNIKSGIKVDQLIIISKDEVEEKPKENNKDKKDEKDEKESKHNTILENNKDENGFIYYEVKKKETLYSISKRNNIDIMSIIKYNPEVENDGLKEGQILKIPKLNIEEFESNSNISNKTQVENVVKPDSTPISYNLVKDIFTNKCDSNIRKQEIKIALLLPYYTDKNINIDIDKVVKEESGFFPNSNFIEFYEGALLAIDTLRKSGHSISLYNFDSKNDSINIIKSLQKISSLNVDLIIGPAYSQFLDLVAEFGKKNNIIVVSPLVHKESFVENNPNSISIMPDFNIQIELLSEFIIKNSFNSNVLLVSNEKKDEIEILQIFKTLASNDSSKNVPFKEIKYNKDGYSLLDQSLKADTENILFIPSVDQAFVTDLVTKLSQKTKKYPITLIGLPVWRKYDNIELDYLHKLKFHTFTNAFVDYNNADIKAFINEYRFVFKNEPSNPYSFLGYDLISYFVNGINKYDDNLLNCISSFSSNSLLKNYNFKRIELNSGFCNYSTFIIKYDVDYNIILVK